MSLSLPSCMLKLEVERDPLLSPDPLDCSDISPSDVKISELLIKLDPCIVQVVNDENVSDNQVPRRNKLKHEDDVNEHNGDELGNKSSVRRSCRDRKSALMDSYQLLHSTDDEEEELLVKKDRKKIVRRMKKTKSKRFDVVGYKCQECDKQFITESHLNHHVTTSHVTRDEYTCDGCMKTFSCVRTLQRHRETFPGEHNFPCVHCHQVFFREANLTRHVEIKHPGDGGELRRSREESENGESFTCQICSKQFRSVEGYEYHKQNTHGEGHQTRKKQAESCEDRKFVCKICEAGFEFRNRLQAHLKTHHVFKNVEMKTGAHACCICPRSFTSSDGLKYHLAIHTGERRYSCDVCEKKFIKKYHMTEHRATHSQVKHFRCTQCPRTFSTHSAYRKHVKMFPGPHSYNCLKCGKYFMKESMLEKHACVDLVKITISPEVRALLSEDMIEEYLCLAEEKVEEDRAKNLFSCFKCLQVFGDEAGLQKHQSVHAGKQTHNCRFCSESFKRADEFVSHIRQHLGSAPYMCLQCNRKFMSPTTLTLHNRTYPGEHSFNCHKCKRWFPDENRRDKHHCLLENSEVFVCACASCFYSWNELLDHVGKVKPYKCCSCENGYTTLSSLVRHLKKHAGVKPFDCAQCHKTFRTKLSYTAHVKLHEQQTDVVTCRLCAYVTKSRKRMDYHMYKRHEVTTETSKSSLCPMCGLIFPYATQMKKHMESEHGDCQVSVGDDHDEDKKVLQMELCTRCGKLLTNKYTLANHMKNVHDKGQTMFYCEECGDSFRTNRKLIKHQDIHDRPGVRNCHVCNKQFYFGKELRKHLKQHENNNKQYSCPTCGKLFKVAVSLKYHSTICENKKQKQKSCKNDFDKTYQLTICKTFQ